MFVKKKKKKGCGNFLVINKKVTEIIAGQFRRKINKIMLY